jgi:methionine sulfoxide reductase heme-binding subunit
MLASSPFQSLVLWRDRTGAFSGPRAVALAIAVAPALFLGWRIAIGDLGPRPLTEVSHVTGLWAVRLLAATLAVTPLVAILRQPRLAAARRILGVSVFCWMVAHLVAFIADKSFDPVVVVTEIVLRIYLLIGFVAFLMLLALAATSTDSAIGKLGAARWRKLHLLTYAVAVLGLAHFFMQAKTDISEPTAMAGVFALLFALRLPKRFNVALSAPIILGLAIVVAASTAVLEAAWFTWKMGAPFMAVIEADFDFSLGLRPCWHPLIVGAVLAGIAAAGKLFPSLRGARRRRNPEPGHGSALLRSARNDG